MKKILIIFSVILGMGVSACSPVKIVSSQRFNQPGDRSNKTYAFAKLSNQAEVKRANSDQIKAFIQDGIVREMQRRDYELTDNVEEADILIDLQLNIRDLAGRNDETRYNRYSRGRYGRYSSPYGYGYGYPYGPNDSQLDTRSSMEATVTILIAEAQPQKKLWRGVAMSKLAQKSEKSAMRLNMVVEQLMGEFE